jgi:hypothetical protein
LVREMRRTARGSSSHTAREKGRYRAVHFAFSKGNGEAMLEQEFIHAEMHHCKKRLSFFPSPAGLSLTKLSLARNNLIFSRPGRVWLVTSQLGTGKTLTFCTVHFFIEIKSSFIRPYSIMHFVMQMMT